MEYILKKFPQSSAATSTFDHELGSSHCIYSSLKAIWTLIPYNHLVLFQEKLKNDSKTVNMHRIECEIGYVL